MKRILKIALLLIFIGLVAWVFYYLYEQSQTPPVEYKTESPEYREIVEKTVATGSVVPRKEIEIKPQESGIIQELYVVPGNMVKKGDLIAKIRIIPEMIQVNSAESQLRIAEMNFRNAEIEFKREKDLYEKGVIPESEFLAQKLKYETAKENKQAAYDHLQLIKEGVTKSMGTQTNTLIRSTVDGMVLDVPVEVGNSVIKSNTFNDGTTVAIVANMGDMIFKGKVDETEVGKIKKGMDLLLTIGALEEDTFTAVLEYIAPKGVEENGAIQFEIKADVKLQNNKFIRAGYSATADIVLERKDSVLSVSEKVLQFSNDTTFVEVEAAPQEFKRRDIKTGLSDGIYIEVLDGLAESDKIKIPI
jgi:HlyD family secretion protein